MRLLVWKLALAVPSSKTPTQRLTASSHTGADSRARGRSGTHNEVETWTQQQIDDGDAPDGTSAGDNKLDEDGNTIPVYQGIDQAKLVPLLTGALREAIAKIETLETQNTTQAAQIADLISRVTALEDA